MGNKMINKVIIVEDDMFFTDILVDALYYEDFNDITKTFTKSDEAEAYYLECLEHNTKPDCLIVDVNLEDSPFDGIELVRRINFLHGNNVVIGVSSDYENEDDIAKCLKVGASFYLLKNDKILPKIKQLKLDFSSLKDRSIPFKIYK